ncbi:hypothetical protein P7C70_g8698, partial [Phenoliferia sp. Uapishka_3]
MSTTPPRASLSGLPSELKALIISLVAAQDAAYKARTTTPGVDGDPDKAIAGKRIEGYGHSLGTLRCLNKEFSIRGAQFMFSTLRVNQSLHPVFRFQISFRYPTAVKRMEFSGNTTFEQVSQVITTLDRFTNLRELSFSDACTIEHIMGRGWNIHSNRVYVIELDFTFAASIFKQAALNVEHLHLDHEWTHAETVPFLTLFPALKTLRICSNGGDDLGDDLADRLPQVVKSLRKLEVLELKDWTSLHPEWYNPWPSTCIIRRIKIRTQVLTIDLWRMVESVSAHLEALELEYDDVSGDFIEELELFSAQSDTNIPFPELKRLVWRKPIFTDATTTPLLARLTPSPITYLDTDILLPTELPILFRNFQRLKSINLHHDMIIRLSNAQDVHQSAILCAEKNLQYRISSSKFSATRPCDLLQGPFSTIDEANQPTNLPTPEEAAQTLDFSAIRRALEFGCRRLERAELDGELNWNLRRSMVQSLESLRLAWED